MVALPIAAAAAAAALTAAVSAPRIGIGHGKFFLMPLQSW